MWTKLFIPGKDGIERDANGRTQIPSPPSAHGFPQGSVFICAFRSCLAFPYSQFSPAHTYSHGCQFCQPGLLQKGARRNYLLQSIYLEFLEGIYNISLSKNSQRTTVILCFLILYTALGGYQGEKIEKARDEWMFHDAVFNCTIRCFLYPNLCTHIFFFLVWGGAALRMNQGRCLLSKGLLGICGRQKVHEEWSWGVLQKVKESLGEDVWWWVTHISQTFTNDPWHLSFIFGFLRDTPGTWLGENLCSTRSKWWGTHWT